MLHNRIVHRIVYVDEPKLLFGLYNITGGIEMKDLLIKEIRKHAAKNHPKIEDEVDINFGPFLPLKLPIDRALAFASYDEKLVLVRDLLDLWYSHDQKTRDEKRDDFKEVFGTNKGLALVRFTSLMITDSIIASGSLREIAIWYAPPLFCKEGVMDTVEGVLLKIKGKSKHVSNFAEMIYSIFSEHEMVANVDGVGVSLRYTSRKNLS